MVVLQLNITVILHQTITGTPHAQVTANHSKYTQATTSAHIQHISNAYGCAEWPRQGPPSHLTRETISGRRPVDGAGTPGGVFCPGENIPLGRRRGYSLRMPLESIADYCETLTSGKPKKRRLPPSTFLTFILNSANRFRRQLPEPPTQALLTSLGTH
ncbi:hypothetical protein HMPREF1020_03254 [Clostridium sp. 7_3_54FAA]|nr:hypothetical protein HMPREF1020_03254 [Clostridium sp. 7_3_54FAA]